MEKQVRVRFAPSPTGLLHLGNARTALFNWLFARGSGGRFILRIEDTDQARHEPAAERGIYVSLKWLALDWDEGPVNSDRFSEPGPGTHGPYRQSERLPIYHDYLERLREKGLIYPCYCAPEELEKERRDQAHRGLPYRYSGKCACLDGAELKACEEKGSRPRWRFRAGSEELSWRDELRGELAGRPELIGDFVVQRANGYPTYNLAVVIDDHLMEITHVIRGDDLLASTARQLLLYRAFGWKPPRFAHLPLITGPDHKPLAKRHGANSLDDLYQQGFLPEAIINYLALLGWSSPSGRELLDREDLVREFSLARTHKSPAIFDLKKLTWVNRRYLRKIPLPRLREVMGPYLKNAGLKPEAHPEPALRQVLQTVQGRFPTLSQGAEEVAGLLREIPKLEPGARGLLARKESAIAIRAFWEALSRSPELTAPGYQALLDATGDLAGLTKKSFQLPLRAALSGKLRGPDLATLMAALGRERVLKRLAARFREKSS